MNFYVTLSTTQKVVVILSTVQYVYIENNNVASRYLIFPMKVWRSECCTHGHYMGQTIGRPATGHGEGGGLVDPAPKIG